MPRKEFKLESVSVGNFRPTGNKYYDAQNLARLHYLTETIHEIRALTASAEKLDKTEIIAGLQQTIKELDRCWPD